ncbi:MAG: RNA polymerase sigma factor [Porticoccaceae bacterium]|jgi:RNA polymerase sigma factor (sigma-70 family)|nr:RNA polymerase sigma factor [Porticoccaceae bacterium]
MEKEEARAARHGFDAPGGVSSMFLEHATFLKRFLAKFLSSEQDIEDVAQEAYLKAYSAEQDKGCIEQPKAFLFSIAKNLALNELTRKSRRMTDYIEDCQSQVSMESAATVENEVEANHSIGLYCEAVANLPEKCRRVYLLRKVHGLSHKEICARLGVSRSTVEKYISMGSLSCRDYMSRREQQHFSPSSSRWERETHNGRQN